MPMDFQWIPSSQYFLLIPIGFSEVPGFLCIPMRFIRVLYPHYHHHYEEEEKEGDGVDQHHHWHL